MIQTTKNKRRRKAVLFALTIAGVVILFLCAAGVLAGLAWSGKFGAGALKEAGRVLGPTPSVIPPPVLDIQSVKTDKGTVVVSGVGTPGAAIEYLSERVGVVNADSTFVVALPVNPGLTAIAIDVVDRYGRTTRLISVPSQAAAPGQSASAGKVKLVLAGAGTDALVGKPPVQTKAEGVYLKLVVTVSSELSEPLNLRTWNFMLRDGQGREYRPSDPAEFAYGWDTAEGRLAGRVVPPNVRATGWVLFDVSPSSSGLVLHISSDGIGAQWAAELAVPDSVMGVKK